MSPKVAGAEPALGQRPVGGMEEAGAEHAAKLQAEGRSQALRHHQQMQHQLQLEVGVATPLNDRQQSSPKFDFFFFANTKKSKYICSYGLYLSAKIKTLFATHSRKLNWRYRY